MGWKMNDFRLTEHFGFFELTRTSKAEYQELNRRKALCYTGQMRSLCIDLLEPVRAHYGKPVIIHSGYRCYELNKAVGGNANSQHMLGQAVDFHEQELKIIEVNKRLQKLYNALETGQVDLGDLAPRIKDIKGQLDTLNGVKAALEAELAKETINVSDKELKDYSEELRGFLNGSSITETKSFLRAWVQRIDLDTPDGGHVKYKLPIAPNAKWAEVLSLGKTGSPEPSLTVGNTYRSMHR